jgi:hypothetical protein
MSAGIKANNDGSAAIQVGGSDAITFTSGLAVTIPQSLAVTGGLTLTGNASGIIKSGTAVASTSGTSIDFTGIPSTAKRVTVMLNGVSTTGTSPIQFQLGISTGPITTGYLGSGTFLGPTTTTSALYTSGFVLHNWVLAANVGGGSIVFTNITANQWVANGTISLSSVANTFVTSGSIALGAVLDRVRITTVGGTDTFDAGSINVFWE